MRASWIAIAAWLLAGCASHSPSELQFHPGHDSPDIQSRTQRLVIERAQASAEFVGMLEFSSKATNLAVLDTQGMVMFSVSLSKDRVHVDRHPDLPPQVDVQQIVQDVRLVNWPERLLLQALPKGLILEQGQRQRDVFRRDQRIASVIYTPNQQQWHEAQLTNYQHNYRLTVKAL